jgi:hypothetical protein
VTSAGFREAVIFVCIERSLGPGTAPRLLCERRVLQAEIETVNAAWLEFYKTQYKTICYILR